MDVVQLQDCCTRQIWPVLAELFFQSLARTLAQ